MLLLLSELRLFGQVGGAGEGVNRYGGARGCMAAHRRSQGGEVIGVRGAGRCQLLDAAAAE